MNLSKSNTTIIREYLFFQSFSMFFFSKNNTDDKSSFYRRCGDFAGATRRLESAALGNQGFQNGANWCMLFIWDQVSLALFVRFWGLWIEYIFFFDGKNFLVDFDMSKRNIMKHPNPMSVSQNFERHH